ncbi:MAG: putative chaperone protein, partial [Phenylobacterium sp.]
GFKEVTFQYEPIAAALAYESTLKSEELALIIDIGGGTSDFTLIRLSPERGMKADRASDILATSGVHIGGTDLDKQLSLKRVMPHFGYKAQNIHKPTMELPYPPFSNFASWHLINTLYEKSSVLEIKEMRLDIAEKHLIDRFIKVIERREAHRVALGVEGAKVGMSEMDKVNLKLDFVEQGFEIALNKADFNETIMDSCDAVVASMHNCLAQAAIKPQQVGAVFLTGGTTAVELFRTKLVADFAHAKIVDGDKFGSVGLGLTLHSRKVFG